MDQTEVIILGYALQGIHLELQKTEETIGKDNSNYRNLEEFYHKVYVMYEEEQKNIEL